MLNHRALAAIHQALIQREMVRPLYESYCFSRIPATVEALFVGEWSAAALPQDVMGDLPRHYRNIVLLFVDSFGWQFLEKYAERLPFLKRFYDQGVVSPLTSQFPSTTAAHVPTIHTGVPVYQTGIYEWWYYEPKCQAMIAPLLFSYAGDKDRNVLGQNGFCPRDFFPRETLYRTLKERGVDSHVFQYYQFTPSPFSDVVFEGSHVHAYQTVQGALNELSSLLNEKCDVQRYFFFYFDGIDVTGHEKGPGSAAFEAFIIEYFEMMEELFMRQLKTCGETLVLLTADHGHVPINPSTTIYVDHIAPQITSLLQCAQGTGLPLAPAGSCRDLFVHAREERLNEAKELLARKLDGKTRVYLGGELLALDMFGKNPSPALNERLGNLVVIPEEGESVWWSQGGRFAVRCHGNHGGPTPSEMYTHLCALVA